MKKSKAENLNNGNRSDHFLELPDTAGFSSTTPDLPVADNIKLCEEMLSTWNKERDYTPKNHPYMIPFLL